MQFKYGTYSFEENNVWCSVTKEPMMSDDGTQIGYMKMVRITGRISGGTQAQITASLNALETALGTNGRDLVLLDNTGAESAVVLRNAGSLGGVQVKGPEYPELNNAQYADGTFVDFTASFEAEYLTRNLAFETYYESFRKVGNGGPKRVILEGSYGPVEQTTAQRTMCSGQQTGAATKTGSYPAPAQPLFPAYLVNEDEAVTTSFTRDNGRRICTTAWDYRFIATQPINGTPPIR